jgi:hypothetical protein
VGDWGACTAIIDSMFTWCPGTCSCNIFGCNCDPCEGCNRNAALTKELTDVPDSEDDHKWYMGLLSQDKLAHLNQVVCQKYGYGDATSIEFVKAVEDRTDENLIDEHETKNNGGVDDGILSHDEFKAAYFDVDDLAQEYCAHPNKEKSGKNGKKSKVGKKGKRE